MALASVYLVSCGSYSTKSYKPPSGATERLLVSQSVTSGFTFPGLVIINGFNDTLTRSFPISGGSSPSIMAVSPSRATVIAYDTDGHTIQVIDSRTEQNTGAIPVPGGNAQTPGTATSMVIPVATGVGYAADPVAGNLLWPTPGAVLALNLTQHGISTQIGVPAAQTLVSNAAGTQLLVFSNDSDSISVLSPNLAVSPIDQGCNAPPNPPQPPVCTVLLPAYPGARPVGALISGTTAYILNCGVECGGLPAPGSALPASVQTLDLTTLTLSNPLPVDGATAAFLTSTTLYVTGTSPTNNACTGQTTAAKTCGRLDLIDLGSMTVTSSVVITDGYHDHMDIGLGGQLFIGSHDCTEIGNVNNPSGEVRGCLTIFDTTKAGNTSVIVPPDNGDVTGLQGFTTFFKEYVVEGGNLKIYDTHTDKLLINNILTAGTISIPGKLIDVKAIDFF